MATRFLTAEIEGRLGRYQLDIYDREDVETELTEIEVEEDVEIQWGEMGSGYPEQILKSTVRLIVRSGADRVREVFQGGFDRSRFPAIISGPGVDWLGYVSPEARQGAFTPRVQANKVEILITDDFEAVKDLTQTVLGFQGSLPVTLAEFGRNTPFDIAEDDWVFRGEFDVSTPDAISSSPTDAVGKDLDTDTEKNAYDAMATYLKIIRGRIYKPLSEKGVQCHPLRETGQGRDAVDDEAAIVSLPGSVRTVPADDVMIEGGGRIQNLAEVGGIRIDLGSDYNLLHDGTTRPVIDPVDDVEIDPQRTFGETIRIVLPEAASDRRTASDLGRIDPEPQRPLGLIIEWEQEDLPNTSSTNLDVTLRDRLGSFADITVDGETESSITLTAQDQEMEPVVEITGQGKGVMPTAQYIDDRGFLVEDLYVTPEQTGVKEVVVEINAPLRNNTFLISRYGRFQSSAFGVIDQWQPFLVQARLERAYRPFGILSVQAELFGLYGPEDLIVLEVPDGASTREAALICGQGRTVNLTTGTTEISDVEIPSDILPTAVL